MIRFSSYSGIYSLDTEQTLPVSLEEAWDFFSSPSNLERITPNDLSFEITNIDADIMYPGQLISYKIGIFPMIKSNWVTEITHVEDHHYFIDEQRFGPYKMWHHKHVFTEAEGKIIMQDKVEFKLPFGFLGRLIYPIVIKPKLERIFTYRRKVLDELFSQTDH